MSTKRTSHSIATRLAVAIALILIAGGILVTFAALTYGRQAAQEVYDKLLAGATFELTSSISVSRDGLVVDLPVSAFEMLALAPDDRVFYRVMRSDGETVTGYDSLPAPDRLPDSIEFYNDVFRGAPVRIAAMRRDFVEQAFTGQVLTIVGQTTQARSALAWEITRNALMMVAAVGALLILLTVIGVRASLRPLGRVERALLGRDPTDLTPLDVEAPQEVRTMVSAIDRFMGRLARRVSTMQNLIADATHQLRTPVAALRAQAELAIEEQNPEQLREIARRIHRRALGLGRLTDQLLNQALIIHRSDAVARQQVDLREVAVRVSEDADHDLIGSGDKLRLELPEEPVIVSGDELSLVEATRNLVSNAFRYGKPPVTITVSLADDGPEIRVTDRGEGIPEKSWPDIGKRFTRTSGAAPDSAGLGLAIVTAVAEAHGGRLDLRRQKGGRFSVVLVFPAATEEHA
ncbi:MAG: sensor histidine kinase N-terminal domain-containing protein [Rhodospirillales bacterium]